MRAALTDRNWAVLGGHDDEGDTGMACEAVEQAWVPSFDRGRRLPPGEPREPDTAKVPRPDHDQLGGSLTILRDLFLVRCGRAQSTVCVSIAHRSFRDATGHGPLL